MIKIKRLNLVNFRNFLSQKLDFSKDLVFLIGPNGVGKTNILESLSVIGRNNSLRGSDFNEMLCQNASSSNKSAQLSIFSEIENHEFIETIALSFQGDKGKKNLEINGENLSSKRQSDVKNHLINFVILTPQLEQLFIQGKSQRREYLDKIVSDIDLYHTTRINDYQKQLKERLLILQKYGQQPIANKWLEIIENKIVELGVAAAFARIEAADFFNKAIASFSSNFPKPKLEVIGEVEEMVRQNNALEIEEFYRQKLKENRQLDLVSFKTNFGIHRSDFNAIFTEKNMAATFCSTGEQKAIMIGITLARAKISSQYKNQPTILIFDEVLSHLDIKRKNDLFTEILSCNLQSFFSATSLDEGIDSLAVEDRIEIVHLKNDSSK